MSPRVAGTSVEAEGDQLAGLGDAPDELGRAGSVTGDVDRGARLVAGRVGGGDHEAIGAREEGAARLRPRRPCHGLGADRSVRRALLAGLAAERVDDGPRHRDALLRRHVVRQYQVFGAADTGRPRCDPGDVRRGGVHLHRVLDHRPAAGGPDLHHVGAVVAVVGRRLDEGDPAFVPGPAVHAPLGHGGLPLPGGEAHEDLAVVAGRVRAVDADTRDGDPVRARAGGRAGAGPRQAEVAEPRDRGQDGQEDDGEDGDERDHGPDSATPAAPPRRARRRRFRAVVVHVAERCPCGAPLDGPPAAAIQARSRRRPRTS